MFLDFIIAAQSLLADETAGDDMVDAVADTGDNVDTDCCDVNDDTDVVSTVMLGFTFS